MTLDFVLEYFILACGLDIPDKPLAHRVAFGFRKRGDDVLLCTKQIEVNKSWIFTEQMFDINPIEKKLTPVLRFLFFGGEFLFGFVVNNRQVTGLRVFEQQIDVSNGLEPFNREFDFQFDPNRPKLWIETGKLFKKSQPILIVRCGEIAPPIGWERNSNTGVIVCDI